MMSYNPTNISLEDNAYIILTHLCNRNCPFCIDVYKNTSKEFLTLEKVKKVHEYLKEKDIKRVTLLGGEPFLNPQIKEICLFLAKYYDIV